LEDRKAALRIKLGCSWRMENRNKVYHLNQQRSAVKPKAKKIKDKLIFILLFFIINLSLLLFLRSPYFAITEVSIKGVDKIPVEDIRTAMAVREGMSIWKVSPFKLRERILLLPRIANVKVERILPGKLLITVKEKYPLAMMPYHDHFLEFAGDGVVIGIEYKYCGELPLIQGLPCGRVDVGSSLLTLPRGEILEVFLQALCSLGSLPVAEINLEDPEQIVIYTWEGMEVWLGDIVDLRDKLEVLQQIYYHLLLLEKDNREGYLDLRTVEAPVFIPFKE
jgi:cell division protein FtsQ